MRKWILRTLLVLIALGGGAAAEIARRPRRIPPLRIGQNRDDARRLPKGQIPGGDAKIALRGGFGAEDALIHLGDVQIDFHDPPLRP